MDGHQVPGNLYISIVQETSELLAICRAQVYTFYFMKKMVVPLGGTLAV